MEEVILWMNTIDQLNVLIPRCSDTLNVFYHNVHGFRSKPETDGVSIISLARCLEALKVLPKNPDLPYLNENDRKSQKMLFVNNLWSTGGINQEIAYSISVAIPGLTLLKEISIERALNNTLIGKLQNAVETLNSAVSELEKISLSKDLRENEPLLHAMFLFRLRKAFSILDKDWTAELAANKGIDEIKYRNTQLTPSMNFLDSYMESRLFYYLSMCSAIPGNEEDAIHLGYLIYTLWKYKEFKNDVIIEHAINIVLDLLFGENKFPRTQLIFKNVNLMISVFPVEILTLFSEIKHVRKKFVKYWTGYNKAYEWILSTQRECFIQGNNAPIWVAEPWRGVGEPEAWLNASVIEFLSLYKDLLLEVCCNFLLVEFGASTKRPKYVWDELIDYDGILNEIKDGFIEPIKRTKSNAQLPKASILLFGPPGTSKTSIARALAWKLRWPYIEILAHHFADEGTEGVIRRAKEIFRRLFAMKRCVVFFDEIDELVAKRESEQQKIGRFITTSVLPWFQDLRDEAQIIFIVATNSVSNFDPAVRRLGRFDFVLPLGPPDEQSRRVFFGRQLEKDGVKADILRTRIVDISVDLLHNIKLSDETKKITFNWEITIGELKYLSESISASLTNRDYSDDELKHIITPIIIRASNHPMIDLNSIISFKNEIDSYRYPPKP